MAATASELKSHRIISKVAERLFTGSGCYPLVFSGIRARALCARAGANRFH